MLLLLFLLFFFFSKSAGNWRGGGERPAAPSAGNHLGSSSSIELSTAAVSGATCLFSFLQQKQLTTGRHNPLPSNATVQQQMMMMINPRTGAHTFPSSSSSVTAPTSFPSSSFNITDYDETEVALTFVTRATRSTFLLLKI